METIEKCVELAKQVKELYDAGYLINISAVGGPTVLMRDTAFDELFHDCEEGEWTKSEYGGRFRVKSVMVDGVTFECVEREKNDGLGC